MKWIKIILAACALACSALSVLGAAPAWETVQSASPASPIEVERLEVEVRDGYIYVTAPKAVTIKVLSIVGQLISSEHLPAGVSRLKVGARGIYILKAGDATLRVTV